MRLFYHDLTFSTVIKFAARDKNVHIELLIPRFLDRVLFFEPKASPSPFPDILACAYGVVPTEPGDESCSCKHARAVLYDKYYNS